MAKILSKNVIYDELGCSQFPQIEERLNICKLKNGNIVFSIRKGNEQLLFETDDNGKKHVINILNSL